MAIEISAKPRDAKGTSASRRLRRENKVPGVVYGCLLYTSPSPRDRTRARMPSSA